ncbi:MAG: histidine kinase [Clostridiales bacterium]|jgi:sensor histidine kinase YesM|nr:histidine kinase [Clostridiales bacterium]
MIRIRLYLLQIASLALILLLGAAMLIRNDAISRERTTAYAKTLLEQVSSGIQSVTTDTVRITQSFAYSSGVQRLLTQDDINLRVREYRNASAANQFITSANSIAIELAVRLNDGRSYMFGSTVSHLVRREIFSKMSAADLRNVNGTFVIFEDRSEDLPITRIAYVLPIFPSVAEQVAGAYSGHCILLCNFRLFFEGISTAQFKEASFMLYAADGSRIFGSPETSRALPNKLWAELPQTGWRLEIHYQGEISEQQTVEYRMFAYAAMASFFLVIFVLALVIRRDITQPIQKMTRELGGIADAPGDQRLTVAARNELGSIASLINHMLDRISAFNRENSENQRRLLEFELALNQMQLKALQSQINPHFLYNTLAALRAMSLERGAPELAGMVSAMIALFRYSVKGGSYVQVREEVDITRQYLSIMNLRTDGKFEVGISIPEELLQGYMVKMILQPVVENAIAHGLEQKEGPGFVSIRGERADAGRYRIYVEDNGLGMEKDAADRLNAMLENMDREVDRAGGAGREYAGAAGDAERERAKERVEQNSIGLANINRKIRLLAGEDPGYGVRVESVKNAGTVVILTLPYLREPPQ